MLFAGTGSRRKLYLAGLWAYVLLTAGGAWSDWPTPEKLARDRLKSAFLLFNALDKSFRPYDTPIESDASAQFERLREDFARRFGPALDLSAPERTYREGLAHMTRDRALLVVFSAASVVVVAWILGQVGRFLEGGERP